MLLHGQILHLGIKKAAASYSEAAAENVLLFRIPFRRRACRRLPA